MILDRFSIWISSEEQWKEDYRTTGELLEWDGERHESQLNTSLFSETCKFHFSLATSGFMNFHPCCTLQDLLYVLITLRKVIKGISQLQDSPRSGLLLTERKSIIILISFPDFCLPLHSLSFLQSRLLFSFDYLFPEIKKRIQGLHISVPDVLEFLLSLPSSAPAIPCLQTNSAPTASKLSTTKKC